MNLLVRSLSGNPSSGSSGSGSPSSPTAPPRSGTRSKRSSRTDHRQHPPLFSTHSSPADLSPTSSRLQRRTASSWSDATRMVYDLEADPQLTWQHPRRTGGFDDYVPPDSAPPSAAVPDFDYFEYYSNYGRGLSAPQSVSPFEEEFHGWHPSRTREEDFVRPEPSVSSHIRSRPINEDHRTLSGGFRRLWRRSSRDTPSFRVTPPGVLSSPSVQVPMNNFPRPIHSLIIENDEEPDEETVLSSSLSQHRSYDHHPSTSSFSPSHHQGIVKNKERRNSSYSSPVTTHRHNHPSLILPRKLSESNPLQRPSIMFHPSSSSASAAFQESPTNFYDDREDVNDVTNDHINDHHTIHHPQHRSGSLYDQRDHPSRYEIDSKNRRSSALGTASSDGGSSGRSVSQRPNYENEQSANWNPFRLSFIETSAYTPQDIPDTSNSPDSEFIPFPSIQSQSPLHSKFQKQLHGEW